MELVEAFKKVWNKVYRPGVMCPDVELAHVHRSLAEVLAEQLPQDLSEAERFVLAKAMIGPPESIMGLAMDWNDLHRYEGKRPEWVEDSPEYNTAIGAFFEAEDAHNQAGADAVLAAVESLVEKGLVEKDERGLVCPV